MSRSATAACDPKPLAGRRVLIIEDEYFLADDIARALRQLGADIAGPVGFLHDALNLINSGEVLDGAVVDVNLRNDMIYPVARALRLRRVPFIFATGYDRSAIGAEFQDVPVWEKPIDVTAMAHGLARLILKP